MIGAYVKYKKLKVLLVMVIAIFFTVIAFTNITDYQTNWSFVKLVLSMEKINPVSGVSWRAINNQVLQKIIYDFIIIYEVLVAFVCWWGAYSLGKQKNSKIATLGIGMGILLYFFGFCVIASEWFAMWEYNKSAQLTAYAFSILLLLVIIFINQNERN